MKPVLIPDINMNYFTPRSLILNYPINVIFLPTMQLLIPTSKLFFLMVLNLIYMRLIIKVIWGIHIGMNICIEMNLKLHYIYGQKHCTTSESENLVISES